VVDGFDLRAQAWTRAALIASADVAALIGDRVVDEPEADIAFPYVRIKSAEFSPDDTDKTRGAVVQVGLVVHSRPDAGGKTEAMRICWAIYEALHFEPEAATITGGPYEARVQTWIVERAKPGAGYEGRLALELWF
jgi:hypothetical protein